MDNVLRNTLKQVVGREFMTKIRQYQHGGETWFPKNKKRIKEEIEKAYEQIEKERMTILFREIRLNQRQISFRVELTKKSVLPLLMRKIPKDIISNLDKFRISDKEVYELFDDVAFRKWVMEEVNKIYTNEGFKVQVQQRKEDGESHFIDFVVWNNIKDVEATIFNIVWSLPSFYDIDLSKIDWNDLYKKLQQQMFLEEIEIQFGPSGIHINKSAKKNYDQLRSCYNRSEYAKTLPSDEMYAMYKKELDAWLIDVTKDIKQPQGGFKINDLQPSYFLKLGKPSELEEITSTPTKAS